jgi:hypothetical protein
MGDDIVWSYRDSDWIRDRDLVGYSVEASDGSIGKVDEASTETSSQWLVVDTGFWIFGKRRLVPAGAVSGVDHEAGRVMVNVSKDDIKGAPDYDAEGWDDEARGHHAEYYAPFSR